MRLRTILAPHIVPQTLPLFFLHPHLMKPPFRVAICGGGIGGLALALVIGKYGHHTVDVFEAGPTITTIGVGIGFFGRTMDIIKALDLYDELVKTAVRAPVPNTGPAFRRSDQHNGYYWFSRGLERGVLNVHRKDLIDLLVRKVRPTCHIHTSKKLDLYTVHPHTGEITLHFSDGSHAVTDVLVGADGIHSATRKTMYQNLASLAKDDDGRKRLLALSEPVWTGSLVYRALVTAAKLREKYPKAEVPKTLTFHLGKDKHIVTYPISQGRLVNVAVFCHNYDAFGSRFEGRWVMDVSEQEILDQFEDWEIHSRALIKCIERPSRWALHVLRPLPHYVDGRVALLGDAAHAMNPHFGAGAGQAIEDAFVLGRMLTHGLTHLGNVAEALKTYEEVRLPFANSIMQRSHDMGYYCGFRWISEDGSVPARGSKEELAYVRKAIEDGFEWQSQNGWAWSDAEVRWNAKCSTRVKL